MYEDEIRSKIIALDAAKFQRLCDAIIKYEGGSFLVDYGLSQDGLKTIKGTPDTYFYINDKICFAEYTVQKDNINNKFKKDVLACLKLIEDEKIPVAEIWFLYNSNRITPKIMNIMKNNCKSLNVYLKVFSIDELVDKVSMHLDLARDILEIPIANRIYSYDDFIKFNNKNRCCTSLDGQLIERKSEFDSLISKIEEKNIICISGKPGVGKTKLGIEVCYEYSKRKNMPLYCINNFGTVTLNDIDSLLSGNKEAIFFIDDVNEFNYIKELVEYIFKGYNLKVVMTVRDYLFKEIKYENKIKFEIEKYDLSPLKYESIKKLIEFKYDIHNEDYLKRIVDLSKDNTRIACMLSELVIKEKTLVSLNSVEEIYKEYYGDIFEGNDLLSDSTCFKTLFILGIKKNISLNDKDTVEALLGLLGIDNKKFLENINKLRRYEFVDVIGDEAYISDQCLSNYIAYKGLIEDNLIEMDQYIQLEFLSGSISLTEILGSLLNDFGNDYIDEVIIKAVSNVWYEIENTFPYRLYDYAVKFHALVPEKGLLYAYKKIKEVDSIGSLNEYFNLLNFFPSDYVNDIMDILISLIETHSNFSKDIALFILNNYWININSSYFDYNLQYLVIDKLTSKNSMPLFTFFIQFLEEALNYIIRIEFYDKPLRLTIINSTVPACEKTYAIRKYIFDKLKIINNLNNNFTLNILSLFLHFNQYTLNFEKQYIILQKDFNNMIEFCSTIDNKFKFDANIVLYDLSIHYKKVDLKLNIDDEDKLEWKIFKCINLCDRYSALYDEKVKNEVFDILGPSIDYSLIIPIMKTINLELEKLGNKKDIYNVFLCLLINNNTANILFEKIIENDFVVTSSFVIDKFSEFLDCDFMYNKLIASNYCNRDKLVYQVIKKEPYISNHIVDFYSKSNLDFYCDINFLFNNYNENKKLIKEIINIINRRNNISYFNVFYPVFNVNSISDKSIENLILDKEVDLWKIYVSLVLENKKVDRAGYYLYKFLLLDNSKLSEFLDLFKDNFDVYDIIRFTNIWLNDSLNLKDECFFWLIDNIKESLWNFQLLISDFGNNAKINNMQKNIINWAKHIIDDYNDNNIIKEMFNLISNTNIELREEVVSYLILHKEKIFLLKEIRLLPHMYSGSDLRVCYNNEACFLRRIAKKLNVLKYAEERLALEDMAREIENMVFKI